jgi:hypothetical protein
MAAAGAAAAVPVSQFEQRAGLPQIEYPNSKTEARDFLCYKEWFAEALMIDGYILDRILVRTRVSVPRTCVLASNNLASAVRFAGHR